MEVIANFCHTSKGDMVGANLITTKRFVFLYFPSKFNLSPHVILARLSSKGDLWEIITLFMM